MKAKLLIGFSLFVVVAAMVAYKAHHDMHHPDE